jgi:hypothetical protein
MTVRPAVCTRLDDLKELLRAPERCFYDCVGPSAWTTAIAASL